MEKKNDIQFQWLVENQFAKIPVIAKWVNDCVARDVESDTIYQYVRAIRYMFNMVKADPKDVVASKKSAMEFWTKFKVQYRMKNPQKGNRVYRVSFRNLLASHDIVFAPRMTNMYGLSSAHDNLGAHAGVSFSPEIIAELGKMMLEDKEFDVYAWFRTALRTGARHKAVSKMRWDRVYFDEKNEDGSESFKLEQHETKDKRNHWFLGENGDWKIKYPPLEIKELLLELKARSGYSVFLWFEDGGSDEQNRRNAEKVADTMLQKFKYYYQKIAHKLDPHTREYMLKRPTHLLRHTFAQQLKNGGVTDEGIAIMGGWRTTQTVGIWYSNISENKRKELAIRCSKIIF